MTDKSMFEEIKAPQEKGPKHYKGYKIQPYEFIAKIISRSFKGSLLNMLLGI